MIGAAPSDVAPGADDEGQRRNWLFASAHDLFVWWRLTSRSREVQALVQDLSARIPAAEPLLLDLFTAFYRTDVRWAPESPEDQAVAAHEEILEHLLRSRMYPSLHPEVRDNPENAMITACAMARSIAERLGQEFRDVLSADASYSEARSAMEREAGEVTAAIEAGTRVKRRRPEDEAGPPRPEEMTIKERRDRLVELEVAMDGLERKHHIDYRLMRSRAEIGHYLDEMDVDGQVGDVQAALVRFGEALATWGDEVAAMEATSLDERLALFRRLMSDERLRRATEMLGRARIRATSAHRMMTRAAPIGIAGLEYGDDLSRVVFSEFALASDPVAEIEFLRRFAEHQLLCYHVEYRGSASRGPLIILQDESLSMKDERDAVAKGISMALIGIARGDGRDSTLIEFSSPGVLERTDFPARSTSITDIVECLSRFLGGTTDFDGPIGAAMDIVETEAGRSAADIVIVTDGESDIHRDTMARLVGAVEEGGCRLFAVCVGQSGAADIFRDVATAVWDKADLLAERDNGEILTKLVSDIH